MLEHIKIELNNDCLNTSFILKMTTQYIVKFINVTNNTETDGYAELFKYINNPVLTVRTHQDKYHESNQTLLYKFITNNFAKVTYDVTNLKCSLVYTDGNSVDSYTVVIAFDANSSSAFTTFKKTLTEYNNSTHEIKYYPNGRELYVGDILYIKDKDENIIDTVANGKGIVYFDAPNHKIKYSGEFEGGYTDGAGIFYSSDQKIQLKVNNISSGVPTQRGFLNINFTNKKDTIEINFNELWEKLKIYDKLSKQTFVSTDSFVNDIAKFYWNKNDIPMEVFIFQDKPSKEQFIELWYKLNIHEHKIDKNYALAIKNNKKLKTITYLCFGILIMLFVIFGYMVYQNMDYY